MNFTKVLLLMFVSLIIAVVVIGGCAFSGYKKTIGLDESVDAAWAQVENQLQRRFDLVPNLVSTVKGVAAHEKDVFKAIADARAAYSGARGTGQKAAAAGMFESALSRLMVIQERYPELKSNESFLRLQDTLEGTENRLSVERKRFNDTVRALNTYIRAFPGSIYASFAGVEKSAYFEVAEAAKEVPKVDFGSEP